MGKTKDVSAFEQRMVVGATQQFTVCIKKGHPPKGHPDNLTQLWEALESTWASIPVERFRHLVDSLPPDELRRVTQY